MNKSKIFIPFMTLFLMLGHLFQIQSQTDKELLAKLVAEDQEAIKALVLYPEDTRLNILEATLHPEALIKLESIQSQTSLAFQELMADYQRNTQEMIWDLTRYPNLIHQLAQVDDGNKDKIDRVLREYPDVVHQRATQAARDFYPQLVKIDQLSRSAEAAFNTLLADYPNAAQASLRELTALPEVLTILTDNIRLTVLVGDIYKKEPEWVLYKADSLNLVVARQNAEEIEDWKTSLNGDPQVLDDLKASAESYAGEYGFDDAYYEYDDDDLYYDNEAGNVVIRNYYYYNYPYWFGYPTWYYYPRWRLYPLWYDWGFYFAPGGSCIVVGLPSFYFMNWYFYTPYHHHHWPHLSSHFANHYYGHRAVGVSSINRTVVEWKDRNRDVVSEDWLRNDGRLTERFKEFGKFESAREKYNQGHPQKTETQKEYLDRNTRKYPKMSEEASKIERDRKRFNEPVRPDIKRNETPVPQKKNEPAVRKPLPPDKTTPKVKEGRDYHKNTWEKPKTTPPKTRTAPAPKIKTQPKVIQPKTPKTTVPKTRKKNGGNGN